MRVAGWILFSLGVAFCLTVIGAGVGVVFLATGAFLLVAHAYLSRRSAYAETIPHRESSPPVAAPLDARADRGPGQISHSMFGR
jgi:hypothetical protein